MTKRQYSDNDKAEALAALDANGGNVYRTARQIGISRSTLQEWANGRVNADVPDIRQQKKEELADVFERVAYKYLRHAEQDAVIGDVTGNAAVITAATAVDKMRLLRGLPTEIISIIPDLVTAIQRSGDDPEQVFKRLLQRANERANARTAG